MQRTPDEATEVRAVVSLDEPARRPSMYDRVRDCPVAFCTALSVEVTQYSPVLGA